MDYPGFVPYVWNNVAYIFRDGYIYNVNKSETDLETGDWVTGSFDAVKNSCTDIEKISPPLKTVLAGDAFYFIGGYFIGTDDVKPFGKLDTSKVPSYYKAGEVVTALFKLVMTNSCSVAVEEVLFSHEKGTFHPSSLIPIEGPMEDEMEKEDPKDKENANFHQDTSNDPFYSLSDPKFLGGESDSDSDIPVDFDPMAQYRKPLPVPSLNAEVKPDGENPSAAVAEDYGVSSTAKTSTGLPFYYGNDKANNQPTMNPEAHPIRKQYSFTPSPSSIPPASERCESSLSIFSPRDSDVELSTDEEDEYDQNPDEDDDQVWTNPHFYDDYRNIQDLVHDFGDSSLSSSDNKDPQISKPVVPREINKNEHLLGDYRNIPQAAISSGPKSVGKFPKEYMFDIEAWLHVTVGEKLHDVQACNNRHLIFAIFDDFAVTYYADAISNEENYGVIFRIDNMQYYDSLVVGGVYEGSMGTIMDNQSANGMPNLTYYLTRLAEVRRYPVHDSVICVSNVKPRSIKKSWPYHNSFTILDIECFGSIAFPSKYLSLLDNDVKIKGSARLYIHPGIKYSWGFVGEFTIYFRDNCQKIFINDRESFHYYLKTKYAKNLDLAGPDFYIPQKDSGSESAYSDNKTGIASSSNQSKDVKQNGPLNRRQLEDIIPTFEYIRRKRHSKPVLLKPAETNFEFYLGERP